VLSRPKGDCLSSEEKPERESFMAAAALQEAFAAPARAVSGEHIKFTPPKAPAVTGFSSKKFILKG